MDCVCVSTTRKDEFVVVATVKKVSVKKDEITFLHRGTKKNGLYSAWVGAKGRLLKKGDRIRINICDWGHEEWNPGWSGGTPSVWEFQSLGKEMIKKARKGKKYDS